MEKLFDKKKLRKTALKLREKYVTNSISAQIAAKIAASRDFLEAKNIALYYPIKNEVDITSILEFEDKNFYFPRCNDLELEFCKYEKGNFSLGKFGIKEPCGNRINPQILDIIYIPALMANSSCYRLGYGKGYYDRFFKKNNIKAKKILVLPSVLINDSFIQDNFDEKADYIISEK